MVTTIVARVIGTDVMRQVDRRGALFPAWLSGRRVGVSHFAIMKLFTMMQPTIPPLSNRRGRRGIGGRPAHGSRGPRKVGREASFAGLRASSPDSSTIGPPARPLVRFVEVDVVAGETAVFQRAAINRICPALCPFVPFLPFPSRTSLLDCT